MHFYLKNIAPKIGVPNGLGHKFALTEKSDVFLRTFIHAFIITPCNQVAYWFAHGFVNGNMSLATGLASYRK